MFWPRSRDSVGVRQWKQDLAQLHRPLGTARPIDAVEEPRTHGITQLAHDAAASGLLEWKEFSTIRFGDKVNVRILRTWFDVTMIKIVDRAS